MYKRQIEKCSLNYSPIRWDKSSAGWLPSRWRVRCCHVRHLDLSLAARVAGECVEDVLQSEAVGVIFKKLEHFSEYNVTVTSDLDHFIQSDASFQLGRTREYQCLKSEVWVKPLCRVSPVPALDYNWTVTLDGRLLVTWLRKFSLYQVSE